MVVTLVISWSLFVQEYWRVYALQIEYEQNE